MNIGSLSVRPAGVWVCLNIQTHGELWCVWVDAEGGRCVFFTFVTASTWSESVIFAVFLRVLCEYLHRLTECLLRHWQTQRLKKNLMGLIQVAAAIIKSSSFNLST